MGERSDNKVNNARRMEALVSERQELFGVAGANAGRTAAAQARLTAIEQELDQCFLAVREEPLAMRRVSPTKTSCSAAEFGRFDRRCSFVAMTGVRLEIDGAIATITNDNPDKHNAFNDDMDAELFAVIDELVGRPDVRAVVWRGEGKSFSSGRDASTIGNQQTELTHHELMRRGHRGIQRLWDLDAPVIVACKGWVMGGSFQRALLCDIRIAAEGTRFRLPELTYGVIPDTGGVGVLYEMCGPGLVSDLVLTGRIMPADEAMAHGIVSRIVPADELDATAREMAEQIAAAPKVTVKMAREVIRHLSQPQIKSSMADEVIYQTFINRSDDFAEARAARAEERPPRFTGS